MRRFGLKNGIYFAHFGLQSGIVFEETTVVCECIRRFSPNQERSLGPNGQERKGNMRIRCLLVGILISVMMT